MCPAERDAKHPRFPGSFGATPSEVRSASMTKEPEQEALFCIEGPDEDGCVWICSARGRDVWCQNLGPTSEAAEVLSKWLGELDYDDVEARR
jgi:hypothetical protein